MTSSQFAQTMPTQLDDEPQEENYVACVDGDFTTRLRWWIDASPGVTTYHIQMCIVCEAGACINTNNLDKEPAKLKEMALKYQSVAKDVAREGIILPSEFEALKMLKHATRKKKNGKEDAVEVEGWPTGRSLWDRYLNIRREVRNRINPLLPKDITLTPSGKGLRKAFDEVSFKILHRDKEKT